MKKLFSLLICAAFLAALFSCSSSKTLSEVKSRYVTRSDSVKVHYKTFGHGDPVLVFIHGFGCDMNAWREQFQELSTNARMVFIDLPGYGLSGKPRTEYTLDFFADAVKEVLDKEKVSHAVLIGHSLGTPVCRQITYKYPELASKLIDVDGVYCFYPEGQTDPAMAEAYHSFAESFNTDSLKEYIGGFVQSLCIPKTPAPVKEYAMGIMPATPKYVAYSTMKNLIMEKYWKEGIISIPTLVIASKNSDIPPDYKTIMEGLYSDMTYLELDSTGHFIMMEKPEMFNDILKKF